MLNLLHLPVSEVSSSDARNVSANLERDDGKMIYEVEFEVGNKEYDYDIDAISGKILDKSVELDD